MRSTFEIAFATFLLITVANTASVQTMPAAQLETLESLKIYHVLDPNRKIFIGVDMHTLYPPMAMRKEVTGKAMLHCILQADAHFHDCSVMSESPPDQGFGEATLKVAQYATVRPLVLNGSVVDQEMIEFSVNWRLSHAISNRYP